MNAERLFKVATEVITDIKNNDIISLLEGFNRSFSRIVSAPNQQQYQSAFVEARGVLFNALENSSINNLNLIDYQIIEEIGGAELLGKKLKQRILDVESQGATNITPGIAYEMFKRVYEAFTNFNKSLEQLISVFNDFGLKPDKILDKSQAEVSILMPRNIIDGDLKKFETDVKNFRDFLDTISEISGEPYRIEKVASSDFEIYIFSGLFFASCVSQVINPILDTFVKIMAIREYYKKLKENGVPEETIQPLQDYENSLIEETIEKSQERLLAHCADEGRKNELATKSKRALTTIVEKFNNGYQVSVSLSEEWQNEEENDSEDGLSITALQNSIKELNTNLERVSNVIEIEGHILQLPKTKKKSQ